MVIRITLVHELLPEVLPILGAWKIDRLAQFRASTRPTELGEPKQHE